MSERRYWIGVVARSDVEQGRAGAYTELNHGRAAALERMSPGDGLVLYSPRETPQARAPLQAFTAIGRIAEGHVYEAEASHAEPAVRFRRSMAYLPAAAAPIRPLIDELGFIRSKQHWGAVFRFGFVRVPPADFARIARAMGCDPAREFELLAS